MRLNKIITNITAIAAALAAMSITAEADASANPILKIGTPEVTEDSVTVELTYLDDHDEIVAYNLKPGHVGLNGFTGNINIEGEGEVKTLTVTDIEITEGEMYITINGGTAVDADGNLANGGKTSSFSFGTKPSPDTGISGVGAAGGIVLFAGAVAAAAIKKEN